MNARSAPGVAALECIGVDKRSAARGASSEALAARDVSFVISPGEVVSIIGPSGCGKSTLLNMGSGLAKPSAGIVKVAGQVVEGPNQHVSFMLQKDLLMPWRRISQNSRYSVASGSRPRGRVGRTSAQSQTAAAVARRRGPQCRGRSTELRENGLGGGDLGARPGSGIRTSSRNAGFVQPATAGGRFLADLRHHAGGGFARRLGQPEEFGAACAFLCSAHADYINGQNLLLDGGSFPGTVVFRGIASRDQVTVQRLR